MIPSMRYETKKLTQLYHMRKSYRDHKNSIDRIKKRQSRSSIDRTQGLNQLRNRMHSAFNYTQHLRAQEINKDNFILYQKCTDDRKSNISLRIQQNKINLQQNTFRLTNGNGESIRNPEPAHSFESKDYQDNYLLKNHRKQAINKLTNYQRSRQNLRLAVKISKPCPAINTKKLQQIHQQAKKHRQRIMKYDSISLKSSKYLQKKLSNNSFRSQHLSISCKSKSKEKSPNHPSPIGGKLSVKSKDNVIPKLNRTSIFRNKHNDHLYGFSLTDYKC